MIIALCKKLLRAEFELPTVTIYTPLSEKLVLNIIYSIAQGTHTTQIIKNAHTSFVYNKYCSIAPVSAPESTKAPLNSNVEQIYMNTPEPFPQKMNERVIYSAASHRGSRVLLAATDTDHV
jgi:hypothetical protein